MWNIVALAFAAAAAAAPGSTAAPTPERVKPSATDPQLAAPDDEHYVYTPGSVANGKLVVFLPGTRGKPANATRFLSEAARLGYHAIGLAYDTHESAAEHCRDDLACYGEFRKQGVEGGPNAIEHRLVALLAYLDKRHPRDGWGAFLDHGALAYKRIAFAGLSQGGGHAAWIGKHHEVARVIMFGAIVDASRDDQPATWVGEASATPLARYVGFRHLGDRFAARIAANWKALGLDAFGAPVSVDGAKRPFKSHQLTTATPEPDGMAAHASVVGDRITPEANGEPVFRDAWDALLVDP